MSVAEKKILHIQIWTMAQNEECLKLLYFLREPLIKNDMRYEAELYSMGFAYKLKQSKLKDLIEYISDNGCCLANILFKFEPFSLNNSSIIISNMMSILSISPTNSLWKKCEEDIDIDNCSNRPMFYTFESKKLNLRWNEVNQKPTFMECFVEVYSSLSNNELYEYFTIILAISLKGLTKLKHIMGVTTIEHWSFEYIRPYLSNYGPYLPSRVLDKLVQWPKAYAMLDKRYEDFYPIMIGPNLICRELASELGSGVVINEIVTENTETPLVILYIPSEILKNRIDSAIRQKWLVPKDSSTADRQEEHNPSLGDFLLKSKGTIHTFKRIKELESKGLLPALSKNERYYHIIHSKYCKILGINPESMIAWAMNQETYDMWQGRIDRYFNSLPEDMDLVDRIRIAHEKVKRYYFGDEIWDILLKKYFCIDK